MTRTTKVERAAAVAGMWWAARLAGEYQPRRDIFAAEVAICVLRELRKECRWDRNGEEVEGDDGKPQSYAEFDYDPHNYLVTCLRNVYPMVERVKLRYALPQKHDLRVYPDRLEPKEGYGNWVAAVAVPTNKREMDILIRNIIEAGAWYAEAKKRHDDENAKFWSKKGE